ncbi:hypothetical protein [Robertmurraya massiliosenegalensis]|nr:hypothetical protein [Robertmurraya massiliosenegalensis]
MFNFQIRRLLIASTILSTLFSFVVIALTVYHHFTITDMLSSIKEKKHSE